MGCRAVHFALTAEQSSRLMDTPGADDEFLMEFVDEIEQAWDKEWLQETDKAWDAIHRCLTDGQLEYGDTVFHKCILGQDNLYEQDDYIISYISPLEVTEVAAAIKDIDEDWFQGRYQQIDTTTYQGTLSPDDFAYTWVWFQLLRAFFQKAASANRAILFTVSQ
jgi:hypothetical protein